MVAVEEREEKGVGVEGEEEEGGGLGLEGWLQYSEPTLEVGPLPPLSRERGLLGAEMEGRHRMGSRPRLRRRALRL